MTVTLCDLSHITGHVYCLFVWQLQRIAITHAYAHSHPLDILNLFINSILKGQMSHY